MILSENINREKLRIKVKKILKNLPENIGFMSLAILMSIGEAGVITATEILEGQKTKGIGRAYTKAKTVTGAMEYYETLKEYKKNSLRVAISRLAKKGLVEKNIRGYKLSKLGELFIKKAKEIQKPKIWDGKWRMAMFDIPEKRRNDRYWLTTQLALAEYKNLQKSVYLGKHPLTEDCFKQIHEKNLINCVRLITIGEIDDDKILEQFNLT